MTNSPITFIGTGEHFDEFETFEAKSFVSRLLGMGDIKGLLTAFKEKTDIFEKAPEMMERMTKGVFTLRDMREQFQSVMKMGNLSQASVCGVEWSGAWIQIMLLWRKTAPAVRGHHTVPTHFETAPKTLPSRYILRFHSTWIPCRCIFLNDHRTLSCSPSTGHVDDPGHEPAHAAGLREGGHQQDTAVHGRHGLASVLRHNELTRALPMIVSLQSFV